jgi:hypothetical protein
VPLLICLNNGVVRQEVPHDNGFEDMQQLLLKSSKHSNKKGIFLLNPRSQIVEIFDHLIPMGNLNFHKNTQKWILIENIVTLKLHT